MTRSTIGAESAWADRLRARCRTCAATVNHGPGAVLHLAGERADAGYLIERGSLLLFDIDRNGRRYGVDVACAGELLEDGVVSSDHRRSWVAETVEPTRLLEVPASCLAGCIAEDGTLMFAVFKHLVERRDERTRTLAALFQHDTAGRIALQLQRLAERLGTPVEDGVALDLTHQQLADLSWTTRPTASHAIGRLKRVGLLASDAPYGQIVVTTPDRLAAV